MASKLKLPLNSYQTSHRYNGINLFNKISFGMIVIGNHIIQLELNKKIDLMNNKQVTMGQL